MPLFEKYPCDNTTAPTYLSFSTASCSALIAFIATVGNFLVILAVILNPCKDLRSPFNYFVANLSFADLVVGVIVAPLSAAQHVMEGFSLRNKYLEDTLRVVNFISCTASLLSLAALALDRYVAITHPLFYRSKLNPVRTFLVCLVVWIISISLSVSYFVVGYKKLRFIFANTAVAVTFFVLLFTNSKIFSFLRVQVNQWDNLHNTTAENLAKKRAIKWEKNITKTLFIVLLLFLACYLPSCICIYIINFCAGCHCVFIHWVRDIQVVLVMANSAVNPFVYALRLENFRKAFRSILTCPACLRRLRPSK